MVCTVLGAIVFDLQLCNMQDSVFVLYHYYIYYMAVSVEHCVKVCLVKYAAYLVRCIILLKCKLESENMIR